MGLSVHFSEYYRNNWFYTYIILKNNNIIIVESWQRD